MENIEIKSTELREKILTALRGSEGKKVLLFGVSQLPLLSSLREEMEYLGCTDKSDAALTPIKETADIHIIPASEMGEDCYFGRFNLIFSLYSFQGLPRLVDEVMALRRLLIKGGKLIIADTEGNGLCANCLKQLKRCGFTEVTTENIGPEGDPGFFITARK